MSKDEFVMPPGQRPSSRLYPISVFGKPKEINLETYIVCIRGLVEEELCIPYRQFVELPKVERQLDIHCVDGWSFLGSVFGGVLTSELFKKVRIKDEGKYVVVKCMDGYSTDLPVEFLLDDKALLAFEMDGKPLKVENGFPLRLVVDGKYAYKDAKWVTEFVVVENDEPGFWEKKGYSRTADVYRNDRRQF